METMESSSSVIKFSSASNTERSNEYIKQVTIADIRRPNTAVVHHRTNYQTLRCSVKSEYTDSNSCAVASAAKVAMHTSATSTLTDMGRCYALGRKMSNKENNV